MSFVTAVSLRKCPGSLIQRTMSQPGERWLFVNLCPTLEPWSDFGSIASLHQLCLLLIFRHHAHLMPLLQLLQNELSFWRKHVVGSHFSESSSFCLYLYHILNRKICLGFWKGTSGVITWVLIVFYIWLQKETSYQIKSI